MPSAPGGTTILILKKSGTTDGPTIINSNTIHLITLDRVGYTMIARYAFLSVNIIH